VPDTSPLIEVSLPALSGLSQAKPWVGVLRKLIKVGYYYKINKIFKKVDDHV